MDAFLASLLVTEVLHRVGDVNLVTTSTRSVEGAVEQTACGSHEGATSLVLYVAGLLANKHHDC